jgi:hypothetical protein
VIEGGQFDVEVWEPGQAPLTPRLFLARDESAIEIRGGGANIEVFDSDLPGNQPIPGIVRALEAQDQSIITLYGSDFNYPLGPIADLNGTLTGQLLDGHAINWTFLREATAQIVLVPEPTVSVLSLAGICGLFVGCRRRARHVGRAGA